VIGRVFSLGYIFAVATWFITYNYYRVKSIRSLFPTKLSQRCYQSKLYLLYTVQFAKRCLQHSFVFLKIYQNRNTLLLWMTVLRLCFSCHSHFVLQKRTLQSNTLSLVWSIFLLIYYLLPALCLTHYLDLFQHYSSCLSAVPAIFTSSTLHPLSYIVFIERCFIRYFHQKFTRI